MSTSIMSAVEHGYALIAALKELRTSLDVRRDQLRVDAAYGIDMRNKDEVDPKAAIEIVQLEGEAAIDAVIKGLTSVALEPEQHVKETLRVPGAVGLPCDLLEVVAQTNEMRQGMRQAMASLGGEMERRKAWRNILRAEGPISGKQALRLTQELVNPTRLSFFWATGSSVKRYQVAALRAELIQQLPDPTDTSTPYDVSAVPPKSVEMTLKTGLNLLARLPMDEYVAIQRPVRPHIRARVDFMDLAGSPALLKSVLAPVPFVYDVATPPPSIKPLGDYEGLAERDFQFSHAKLDPEPYFGPLNVHRYLKKAAEQNE